MTGGARVVEPERSQLSWDLVDLDAWLPADHRARVVWAFVLTLNLDPLYSKIKAREGEAGPAGGRSACAVGAVALWHDRGCRLGA